VKANRVQIERALDAPDEAVRLILLHGPDDSGSRALAGRLTAAMGADAEAIDLAPAALKADPALLADEAASGSLFGARRHIRVVGAGDEIADAAQALLEAPAAGNPVVVVAGALRRESKLLKLAVASPAVLAFASYLPEGVEADRLAAAMAREAGLRLGGDVAQRLAGATGGDRALLGQEIEKLALFVDAAPDRPRDLDHDALDAVGADAGAGDMSRLVDAVLSGVPADAEAELARLADEGVEGIFLLRAVLRRLLLLAQLRAEVERGNAVEAVMAVSGKSLFWKDKQPVSRQLALWRPDKLSVAIGRIGEAERRIKAPRAIGPLVAEAELLTIAREAARLR
jgi:DNA polymerase-3 subunit delta